MDQRRACGRRRARRRFGRMRETTEAGGTTGPACGGSSRSSLILAGLATGYAMGWHCLPHSVPTLPRAARRSGPGVRPSAARAARLHGRLCQQRSPAPSRQPRSLPCFRRLPVRLAARWAGRAGRRRRSAPPSSSSSASTGFGDALRARAGRVAARLARAFARTPSAYLLVLRLAPFFPFGSSTLRLRLRAFGSDLRRCDRTRHQFPATFALPGLARGSTACWSRTAASGRKAGLRDLVTPEITIALAALALVGRARASALEPCGPGGGGGPLGRPIRSACG